MQHIKAGPFSSFTDRLAQLRDGNSGKQGERWDLLSSGTYVHTNTSTNHLKVLIVSHACMSQSKQKKQMKKAFYSSLVVMLEGIRSAHRYSQLITY